MLDPKHLIGLALPLAAILTLSACGGSDTDIVELEPVPNEEHDHGHEDEQSQGEAPETRGRLVVAEQGEPHVMVYDLDDGDELAHYELAGEASGVYGSPDHRFALVLQRDGDLVNAVDAGFIRASHDDHYDYTIAAPSFSAFEAPGSRPTHFTVGEGDAVVFYDGNADTAEVAEVGVFSSLDLAEGRAGARITLDTHQHGAARRFGDYLFATVRDPADTSTTLPDQVALYHRHDGEFEWEQTFDTLCPGLHGSAQWIHGVAFGCTDGVLAIHDEEGGFSAEKIANPDGMSGRVGSLYAGEDGQELVGVASGELFLIAPELGTMEALNWRDDERAAVAYDFDAAGEHFLILDDQGALTRLDVADGWTALPRIPVVASDLSSLPEEVRPNMTVSHAGHFVYVTDPVANTVLEVDLESGAVTTVLTLEGTPSRLAWTGFEGALAEHDHAH